MRPSLSIILTLTALAGAAAAASGQTYPAVRPDGAALHSWLGVEYHENRRLNEASREYARALAIDPGRELTADEWTIARRFAPRLFATPTELFGLRDAAVVMHPDRRLIAYHLFWDDDVDFPEDNDPCDHEVIWVAYAAGGKDIEQVYSYFHGRILAGTADTLKDARANGGRPRIQVQCGKHGSSKRVDPTAWFDRTKMARVSRWNRATISQRFLSYNFRAKLEWPPDTATDPDPSKDLRLDASSTTLASFQLPAKTVWDKAMPRYPNLWVYVDASLASSYQEAVALATGMMRQSMRMEERFGPFSNPEACDFEAGLEHLQPWQTREDRALQHGHAFHIRYYYSALERQKLEKVTLQTAAGPRAFYRLPTSAHYEVEHHNPNHADVEKCPICGRTGDYANEVGNLVEKVHDPLGVELAVTGTIRGENVIIDPYDPLTLRGAAAFNTQFTAQHFTFPSAAPDQNTLKIGVIVITPPTGS